MASAADRLLDALERHGSRVQRRGRQVQAQCPSHDDQKPSLSVLGVEGAVLLKCQVGCATEDVVAALGMELSDLFDSPRGARYDYPDGRVVWRSPEKEFRQYGNKQGTALYRADKVAAAVKAGTPVFVVEGEKDVHSLEAAGHVGTCNPMGAGKWGRFDHTPLHGGKVTIVADDDEPGRRHAAEVFESLRGKAQHVAVYAPKVGKDISDHLLAGYGVDELVPLDLTETHAPARRLVLTPASAIPPRRVRWLWEGRLALGTLGLMAGPEGVGKSTLSYWLAARITRGNLPGEYHGQPKAVLICATEDSWEHTIVPRLIAAGADLTRAYRVEAVLADDIHVGLTLPRDNAELEQAATHVDAALLMLDPLMSRLDGSLDTHKDAEVRRALEPLVSVADRTGMAILGLMHHNKSGSTDPLNLVMASKAFTAVARSVHTVIRDPDDDTRRLFGSPKNNLGRSDLPTLAFTITGFTVDTTEGPSSTSQMHWLGEVAGSIQDAMRKAIDLGTDTTTAVSEAADWLEDYLTQHGATPSAEVKRDGRKAGFSESAIKRAAGHLKLTIASSGFPRVTAWSLPVGSQPVGSRLGETAPTGLTELTVNQLGQSAQSVQSAQSGQAPTRASRLEPAECRTCGEHLLLLNGRTICERCRIDEDRQAVAM